MRPRAAVWGTLTGAIRPWMIVGLVAAAYGGVVLASHDMDPLAFAMLGTQSTEADPAGTQGYDGQFAYQIAMNPLGAAPFIDVPAYRYQRILYPLLVRVLSLGRTEWIPWALILTNWLALVAGTSLMERLLARYQVSPWYALGFGLYSGQLLSLRLDLNEPLASLLILVALHCIERKRWLGVGVFLALAALAKETSLIFLGGILIWLLSQRRFLEILLVGSVGGIPFALYQVFLVFWLGSPGLGSGGAGATPFTWIPFGGLWAVFPHGAEVFALFLVIMLPWVVLPTLACLSLSVLDLVRGQRHHFVWLLLLNSLATMFLPFSTYREPLAMARLTIGLVMATILYGAWKRSRRTLNYSLFWLATLALVLKE